MKFNFEGVDKFKVLLDYECFVLVFDELRLFDVNVFVMNILLCEFGDYDVYNVEEFLVGLYLDIMVGIYFCYMFIVY